LRRIWPHLLPHYDAPVTWYRRWVDWILDRNRARPWRAPHHGDAGDLVDFLTSELVVLGLQFSPVADLLRYEATKLAAASLPTEDPAAVLRSASKIGPTSVLRRNQPILVESFASDIGGLVTGRSMEPVQAHQWVAFIRQAIGTVDTLILGEAAHWVLERAIEPVRADELTRVAFSSSNLPDNEDWHPSMTLLQTLVDRRLLTEVQAC
jgi:hypothetical protein